MLIVFAIHRMRTRKDRPQWLNSTQPHWQRQKPPQDGDNSRVMRGSIKMPHHLLAAGLRLAVSAMAYAASTSAVAAQQQLPQEQRQAQAAQSAIAQIQQQAHTIQRQSAQGQNCVWADSARAGSARWDRSECTTRGRHTVVLSPHRLPAKAQPVHSERSNNQ